MPALLRVSLVLAAIAVIACTQQASQRAVTVDVKSTAPPVRRQQSASDQSQLIAICQSRAGIVSTLAIDPTGSYALVHCHGTYWGGGIVATKSNGKWQVKFGGGGVINAPTLIHYGIPTDVANYLDANQQPPSTPTPTPAPTSSTASKPVPINVYAADDAAQLAAVVRNVPPRVYVPNSLAGTVDVIDPLTYAVVDHYAVGKLPHHITPSWDLKHLYVNNTRDSSLTVIDPATGRPVETIAVTDPYNLYFTPDGTKAIVVAERDQSLDFRDPHTWSLLKSVAIPWRGVDHLDFSADGRYLVASTEFSGEVVRVDAVAMSVTDHISVGGQPIDVKLAPDGSVFFVANQMRDGVSVIDPQPLREIAFIATGRGAHGLCVSRDGKWLYVSNRRDGSISVIDFQQRQVVAKWEVGGSPDMMQVSPDGAQLWVSNRYGASVSVIDTRSGRLLHQIAVGPGPHGLSYFPQPGRFSIGHNGVYR